jgi:hypothetical protein
VNAREASDSRARAARLRLADLLAIPDTDPIPPLADLVDQLAEQAAARLDALDAQAERAEQDARAEHLDQSQDGGSDFDKVAAARDALALELHTDLATALGHTNVPGWRVLLSEVNGLAGQAERTRYGLRDILGVSGVGRGDPGPEVVTDDLVDLVRQAVRQLDVAAAEAVEASWRNRRTLDELRGHIALALGRSSMAPLSDTQLVGGVRELRQAGEFAVQTAHQLAELTGVRLDDGQASTGWQRIAEAVRRLSKLRDDVAGAVRRDPTRLGDFELVELVRQAREGQLADGTLRRQVVEQLNRPDLDDDGIVAAVRELGEVATWRTQELGALRIALLKAMGWYGHPTLSAATDTQLVERVRELLTECDPRVLDMPDEPGADVVEVWTQDADTGEPIHWLRDLDDGRPQGWVREVGGGHLFWPELLERGPVLLDDPRIEGELPDPDPEF